MKIKYRQLFLLLWVSCFLFFVIQAAPTFGLQEEPAEEHPVKVTFENNSGHTVLVHILSYDMIAATHTLTAGQGLDIEVEFGNGIRLEYPTPPHKTTLSQMGSRNELFRTVSLRNDGDNIFIQEKFSGQREKGKGEKRRKFPYASVPQDLPEPGKTAKQNQGNLKEPDKMQSTRKEDPLGPEP
ncbi:MAG: hypothetical protein GY950_33430, partial [bacterium]|nr:hypothetical protein [bacterium]